MSSDPRPTPLPPSLFRHLGPWTVDDLDDLPDDGNRYELIDGRLLVSTPRRVSHVGTVARLYRTLALEAPADLAIGEGPGIVSPLRETCLAPDLAVLVRSALEGDGIGFQPAEVLLAVEVLTPGDTTTDVVTKRHYYARMGIPRYWIVDAQARTLTVLTLDGERYGDEIVVKAGETWRTDEPFPLELDPADFC